MPDSEPSATPATPARTLAVLGAGRSGKTFVAAHIAMALGYLGIRTLLVGCDQKRDTHRAVTAEPTPSLGEALEEVRQAPDELALSRLSVQVTPYVDVMELGGAQLLVGRQEQVWDTAWRTFEMHRVFENYEHIIFDVKGEQADATLTPLLRRVNHALLVCGDDAGSLFVANRLMRAILIGANELKLRMRLLGLVHNRFRVSAAVDQFVQRTHLSVLHRIPELEDLAALRAGHQTLFGLQSEPPHLRDTVDGLLRIAEWLRGEPFLLQALAPMSDDELWKLEAGPLRVS